MVKETEKAWLAGILDGEGTIHLGKGNYCVKGHKYQCVRYVIIVSNTDPSIILECKRVMNLITGDQVNRLKYARVSGNRAPQYLVRVTSRSGIKSLLNAVLPYLIGKKQQAEILLEYIGQRESKWKMDSSDFAFTDRMYRLNTRRPDRFLPIVETVRQPEQICSEDTVRADGQPSEVDGNDLPA